MSSDSSLLSNTLSNHTKSDNEPIERGRIEGSFYESNDSEFIEEEMIILVSFKSPLVRVKCKVDGHMLKRCQAGGSKRLKLNSLRKWTVLK